MLRVVIHGGLHKTGTTSLQHLLAANHERLLADGIYYPGTPQPHQGRLLNVKRPDWSPEPLRSLIEEARATAAETLVLSGETVSTLPLAEFKRLTACFADCELTYLFCFRHWAGFLPSRWRQRCHRRDSQPFDAYLARVLDTDHPDCRFDLVPRRALDSGRCNVRAVSYDNAMLEHADIVPAMLDAMGFTRRLTDEMMQRSKWLNESADVAICETKRLLNGALADALNLPQDDLFRAVMEGRPMDVAFDLESAWRALPKDHLHDLQQRGAATLRTHRFEADWTPSAASALEAYDTLFVNRHEGAVFPRRGASEITYWGMEWPQVRQHPACVEMIAQIAPVILKRCRGRRQRERVVRP